MDASPSLPNGNNGKNGLNKKLAAVGERLVSFPAIAGYHFLLLALLISLSSYYQNELGQAVLLFFGLWFGVWEMYRRRKGRLFREIYLRAVAAPLLFTLLSNFVIMDILPIDRVTVAAGLNGGLYTITKNLQPILFIPGRYQLTRYQLDQSVQSECRGQLKTGDEQEFFALVSLPLKLINDQQTIMRTHQIAGNEQKLKQLLEKIVCLQSADIVKSVPNIYAFGPAIRLSFKEIYEHMPLDKALQALGVSRGADDYLFIRNLMVINL